MPAMDPADDNNLMLARVALLRRATAELPLATTSSRGEPLRWRVRESEPEARAGLLVLWREALDALHHQGFGTDGAVAAARYLPSGRVAFDPERVWPLGALVSARPVAAWLDHHELHVWLNEAGHTAESPFSRVGSPWSDASPTHEDDTAGATITVVAGPSDETIAIAASRGLVACRADELREPNSPIWVAAVDALVNRGSLIIAVTTATTTNLIPTETTSLRIAGRTLPLDAAERATFGLRPHAPVSRPDLSGQRAEMQRAIEGSQLIADRRERLRTRARLLTNLQPTEGAANHRSLSAAVDLARDAGDRNTLIATLMRRAGVRWLSDPVGAIQDATEARRLASTVDDAVRFAAASALEALVTAATKRHVRSPPSLGSPDSPRDRTLSAEVRALDAIRGVAVDGAWRHANDATRALNLALLAAPTEVQALVVERVAVEALAYGFDLDAERILGALVTHAPPLLRDHCRAWIALFAARRGASLTATDHLVRLGDAHGLLPRTATIAAMAARSSGMDALADRLATLDPGRDAPSSVAAGAAPDVEAPLGWWALFAELLMTRRDAEARRVLQGIEAQISPWLEGQPDASDPLGLLVAVGTLLASLGETRARPPLYRALGAGRLAEYLEIRALSALALITAPESDEGRAISARLEAFPSLSIDRENIPPAPLTPHEATERVLEALRNVTEALGERQTIGDGRAPALRALETLLGPVDEPEEIAGPMAASLLLSDNLAVMEADGGAIALSAWIADADGAMTRAKLTFDGPAALTVVATGDLLRGLRPLLALKTGSPPATAALRSEPDGAPVPSWRDDSVWLDRALRTGAILFFPDVRGAFNRHEITQETVRGALKIALSHTSGVYKTVATRWSVGDYRRFMDFLRRNGCLEDFRLYRN